MLIKKIQHKIFSSKVKKIAKAYLLALALSLWGIGNVFYWEIYKGYKACNFCKWHRGLYFGLFITLVLLYRYRMHFFKFLVFLIISVENVVSVIQILGLGCNPMMCRRVSIPEKFNFGFAISTLIILLLWEFYGYIKMKYLRAK